MEAARAKDTKERLAGVEWLHEALVAAARRGLTSAEATTLVDTCVDLTRDANFRVAQGGLQALAAVAVLAGVHFKIHLNALVPAAVECLGDGKQPVREVQVKGKLFYAVPFVGFIANGLGNSDRGAMAQIGRAHV